MKLFFTLFLISLSMFSFGQKNSSYPVIVGFHSMCCGVPSDSLLKNTVTEFKKKYKIKKIAYDRIGPLGREGEYSIAFPLKELTKKQKTVFIQKLKLIVPEMKDQGNASIEENAETVTSSRIQKQRLFM